MYVCMYICVCICMYTYMYIYVCIYTYIYIYMYIYICMHVNMYIFIHVYIYICMYIYIYIFVCVYVYDCICVYIYMIKFEIREIRKLASQCWMSPLQSSSSPQAPMMMKLPLTTLKLQQKLRQRRWLRNVPSHDLLPKWQWYGMGTRSSGQDVLRYDDIINFWKNIF